MPKQILIVDDSPMVRRMVRSSVEAKTDWHVCGEAENGEIAVRMVEELDPDLVVLDLSMPVMNGLEAAYEIRRAVPSAKIVFFDVEDCRLVSAAARLVGADAFIPHSAEVELVPTVKRLLRTA